MDVASGFTGPDLFQGVPCKVVGLYIALQETSVCVLYLRGAERGSEIGRSNPSDPIMARQRCCPRWPVAMEGHDDDELSKQAVGVCRTNRDRTSVLADHRHRAGRS